MAIQNQGYRQDLNFLEHTNDTLALSNLGGVGLSDDLRIIQNNLRNTARLPFTDVNVDTDEFVFDVDKTVRVVSLSAIPDPDLPNTTLITATLTVTEPYDTYVGGLVTVSNVQGVGSTIFNGSYPSILIGAGGTNFSYRKPNCIYTGSAQGSDTSSASATFSPVANSVFTNDDVVTLSRNVSVGSTVLSAGTEYFVCNSNAVSRFKLSFTPSVSGISTVSITSTPTEAFIGARAKKADFNFIKKEPVFKQNLENFIKPDVQDDEFFGGFLNGSINNVFSSTQTNIENSNYFITKKYKGTDNTSVDTEIKFEGTVNIFDPGNFNRNVGEVTGSALSPGIFIGNTRAFSADNNPWSVSGTFLETNSDEVTIGELLFADEINMSGVNVAATSDGKTAQSFTHKVPAVINGETYYLLMTVDDVP